MDNLIGGLAVLLMLSPIVIGYAMMFRDYQKQHRNKRTELDKDTEIAWLKEQVAMYQEMRKCEHVLVDHYKLSKSMFRGEDERYLAMHERAVILEQTGTWIPEDLIPFTEA